MLKVFQGVYYTFSQLLSIKCPKEYIVLKFKYLIIAIEDNFFCLDEEHVK